MRRLAAALFAGTLLSLAFAGPALSLSCNPYWDNGDEDDCLQTNDTVSVMTVLSTLGAVGVGGVGVVLLAGTLGQGMRGGGLPRGVQGSGASRPSQSSVGHAVPPGEVLRSFSDAGFGTRTIDGQVHLLVPSHLPHNVTSAAFHTTTAHGLPVIDTSKAAHINAVPLDPGANSFHHAINGNLEHGESAGSLVLPDGVDNALHLAAEQSLGAEEILQELDGTLVLGGEVAAASAAAVGLVHAHVYRREEGGSTDVAFSEGDYLHFFHKGLNVMAVQSGKHRYVAARTDATPGPVDPELVRHTWDDGYARSVAAGGSFQDSVRAANFAVAKAFALRLYHGTGEELRLLNR